MMRTTSSALLLSAALAASGLAAGPVLRLDRGGFEVAGLGAVAKPGSLTIHVVLDPMAEDGDRPAVLGTTQFSDGILRFEPRFPLVPGVRYRAVYRPGSGPAVMADFQIPKPPATVPELRQIYPSRNVLPENQLKFYLHFSAPMSRGESYRHIHLVDEAGKPVEDPFLELDEELWDPAGQRFTLFFDPGRIKRGLKPREEVGPSLIEGKRYTLVIDRRWEDAAGNPLKETVRKPFRVAAPDDAAPDPKDWKIGPPAAGGVQPLEVAFPEPLDHGLLQRLLWVTDAVGRRITGTVQVSDEETRWHFTPAAAWRPGRYELVVDATLEDLAGNSIGRPFEVDVFKPINREVKTATVSRPFLIK